MDWHERNIAILTEHLNLGRSYSEIGALMGCSRSTIAGAVRRWVHGIHEAHEKRHRDRRRDRETRWARMCKPPQVLSPARWTEDVLTEPYAKRKLRLAAEREARV